MNGRMTGSRGRLIEEGVYTGKPEVQHSIRDKCYRTKIEREGRDGVQCSCYVVSLAMSLHFACVPACINVIFTS